MSQYPIISNAPQIGGIPLVQGSAPVVPMLQTAQANPMQNVMQMKQMRDMAVDLFGGGGVASQAPGLQASGAVTAGAEGATAAEIAGTPMSATEGVGALSTPGAGSGGLASAGPWAALAAMFAGNEAMQNKMGNREKPEDFLKALGTGGYSDQVNYLESPAGKVRDELYTPAEGFLKDDIYKPIENLFSGIGNFF